MSSGYRSMFNWYKSPSSNWKPWTSRISWPRHLRRQLLGPVGKQWTMRSTVCMNWCLVMIPGSQCGRGRGQRAEQSSPILCVNTATCVGSCPGMSTTTRKVTYGSLRSRTGWWLTRYTWRGLCAVNSCHNCRILGNKSAISRGSKVVSRRPKSTKPNPKVTRIQGSVDGMFISSISCTKLRKAFQLPKSISVSGVVVGPSKSSSRGGGPSNGIWNGDGKSLRKSMKLETSSWSEAALNESHVSWVGLDTIESSSDAEHVESSLLSSCWIMRWPMRKAPPGTWTAS